MRIITILLTTFAIAGCNWLQSPIDDKFDTYLTRIANVQDSQSFQFEPNINIIVPDKRDLAITIPNTTIGLLDSYELRKCGLFNLIAEKNSVLGKVQDQFRNFDYQIQVIDGIEECLVHPSISVGLKEQLAALLATKRAQIGAHFTNLVFTSEAMRAQLIGYEWLEANRATPSPQLVQALEHIDAAYQDADDKVSAKSLNLVTPFQEVIEKERFLGILSFSMLNASLKLRTVTKQLEAFDKQIICGQSRDTTKFQYLKNVFQNYYIDGLQPYLAKLDSSFMQLEPTLGFLVPNGSGYHYPIHQHHSEFRQAILQHVDYWKSLFKRCGANPARD